MAPSLKLAPLFGRIGTPHIIWYGVPAHLFTIHDGLLMVLQLDPSKKSIAYLTGCPNHSPKEATAPGLPAPAYTPRTDDGWFTSDEDETAIPGDESLLATIAFVDNPAVGLALLVLCEETANGTTVASTATTPTAQCNESVLAIRCFTTPCGRPTTERGLAIVDNASSGYCRAQSLKS